MAPYGRKRGTGFLRRAIVPLLAIACLPVAEGRTGAPDARPGDAFAAARSRMVERQIAGRGITTPRLLDALRTVPRHLFVPGDLRERAYEDGPLPIGRGQTISQPYVVAFMTALLDPRPGDRVLEIGTGSGYQAAVLAELAGEVYSVEIDEFLGRRAERLLRRLGYRNLHVRIGDGYEGWKEHAPYDAVIVTCAPSRVPEPLTRQLREGGRMIIPVGSGYRQSLVLLRKTGGRLERRDVLPVRFVPMVDRKGRTY